MKLEELKFHIIENSIPVDPVVQGLYFLIRKDEIVYIGKSNKVHRRIEQHLKEKQIKFDRWFCQSYVDMFVADQNERMFIDIFRPKHNTQILKSSLTN